MTDAAASGFRGLGRTEVVRDDELVPVDAHRDRLIRELHPLEPIELGLADVLGLVLAEDVVAEEAYPPFTSSAMDGYAVVAADTQAATGDDPVRLRVVGEAAAAPGDVQAVGPGTALRIMTGAQVPEGADAVVPVELTRESAGEVTIHAPATPDDNVRPAGTDLRVGQVVLRRGRRLRPGDIAVLATLGRTRVHCHPRPRVVVLSTGSELLPADQALVPGALRDSNGPMLTALLRQAGAVTFWAGIVRDDRRSLLDAFDSNIGHADLFVTTGGVSAGAHDHVRDVLDRLGEAHHTKVGMKPGMPQLFGRARGVPVLGLPGNPVSAFVSFEVFVRPVIRRLQGRTDLFRPTVQARLEGGGATYPAKRHFLRVSLRRDEHGWVAQPAAHQGSHQVGALVEADGLAELPEGATVGAGDTVRVHLLIDP
ncbi:MAG: molybdopterin molybdotransferase MoeA [Nitriliruptorales bacterium]